MNETIAYELSEHKDDPIATRFGAGWFFTFDTTKEPELFGPYETKEAADAAAKAEVQQALTDMVHEALGLAA